jgi:hypothetical protein
MEGLTCELLEVYLGFTWGLLEIYLRGPYGLWKATAVDLIEVA